MAFRFINYAIPMIAVAVNLWMLDPILAIDEFEDIKTIQTLPITFSEVESAHLRSRNETCELIGEGELSDTTAFVMHLTDRDRKENKRRPPSSRRSMFSVGLAIDPAEQTELPQLSRSQILSYLDSNFVAIQARIRQDLLDRKPYLHHRPLAITTQYASSRLTVPFEPVIAENIRDFHSLGLFTSKTSRWKPEDLRTLVLLFKNNLLVNGQRQAQYEFAFIQAIAAAKKETLEYHTFVTTEDRNQLNYLGSYQAPKRYRDCSIRGSIAITGYDSSGIFPKSSATKSFELRSTQQYTMERLQNYCANENLSGGFQGNVDKVLLAIIKNPNSFKP